VEGAALILTIVAVHLAGLAAAAPLLVGLVTRRREPLTRVAVVAVKVGKSEGVSLLAQAARAS
jgi:hypothetical protein